MTPNYPWSMLPLAVWLASLYYFIPALLIACVLLLVPALRRNIVARSLGIFAAVIAGTSVLAGAIVFLQFGTLLASDALNNRQRTHHLETSQTLAGVLFPAGSTIVLEKDHPDFIETGTLSAPTVVHGLLLTGTFTMPAPSEEHIGGALSGTLAQPATIAGLPCAAAAININDSFTSCILARGIVLHGFSLAGGTYVQTRRQPGGDFTLEQASLAVPTPIFDVVFPAGTIFTPDEMLATRAAHSPFPPSGITIACLPPGGTVTLAGAVLTGPIAISYSGEEATVDGICPYRAGDQEAPAPVITPGFGLVHDQRFGQGSYEPKTNTWNNLNSSANPAP